MNLKKSVSLFLASLLLASMVMQVLPQREANAAGEWSGYNHFEYIRFYNGTNTTFTNVPVIFEFNYTNFDFSTANTSGQDLRFSAADNVTELPYIITSWNAINKFATGIVNVPTIAASSNYTDYIIAHWGNGSVSDNQSTLTQVVGTTDPHIVLNAPLYAITADNWTTPDTYAYAMVTDNYSTAPLWTEKGKFFDGNDFIISNTLNWASTNQTGTIIASYTAANSSAQFIFSTADNASTNKNLTMGSLITAGQLQSIVRDGTTSNIFITDNSTLNGNVHVSATSSNGTNYKSWIDGRKENITVTSGSDNGNWSADVPDRDNFSIGARIMSSISYSTIFIGEVVVYDYQLSDLQVSDKTNEMLWRQSTDNIYYQQTDVSTEVQVNSSTVSVDKDGITNISLLGAINHPFNATYFDYGLTPYTTNTTLVSVNMSVDSTLLPNAASALVIPTYDGSGQITHPDVVSFNTTWNGYKYWMAMTPFPDEPHENPSIVASNDKTTWAVPAGLVNPIDPYPGVGKRNADTGILYESSNSSLLVYYNELDMSANISYLRFRTSMTGNTWSSEQNMMTSIVNFPDFISQSIQKVGSTYYMWYGHRNETSTNTTMVMRTSSNLITWSAETPVNINTNRYYIWHSNVKWMPEYSEFWMMANCVPKGVLVSSALYEVQIFARSVDGINWVFYDNNPVLSPSVTGFDNKAIYRSGFLLNDDELQDWYASVSSANSWQIGYTQMSGQRMTNIVTGLLNAGNITVILPTNLIPGQTYHFRLNGTNEDGITSSPDSTFTLTLPSVTTGTPTNVGMNGGTHATLNGTIDDMGVASDAYASYQYSTDLSYNQSTPEVTVNAIGAFTQNINGFLPNQTYNVRLVTRVGAVYTYGLNQTFYTAATATFNLIDVSIIIVVALLLLVVIGLVLVSELSIIERLILIGVVIYAILALLPGLQNLLSALQ